MTYLVRWTQRTSKGTSAHYREVDPDNLMVQYHMRRRRTGETVAGFPVVKDAGYDKSIIYLKSRTDVTRSSRGTRSPVNGLFVKLLDRHKSIRIIRPEDVEVLTGIDERIALKEAELKMIRDERHAAVEAAWRRADKVDIDELEKRADA